MSRFCRSLLTLVCCVVLGHRAFSGAWTQAKGSGFAQFSYTHLQYGSLYGLNSSAIGLHRNVLDRTFQNYFEYGLTNELTFLNITPLKWVSTADELNKNNFFADTLPSGSLLHIGNPSIGLRYGFLKSDYLVSSAQLRMDMGNAALQDYSGLQSGSHCWGFAPSMLLGGSYKFAYATTEVGLNLRTNSYLYDFFGSAEVGIHYKNRVFLVAALDWREPFGPGRYTDGTAMQTGLYLNGQSYLAYGFKVIGNITKNWGVSYYNFTASNAALVARARPWGVAVHYKW